MLENRHTGKCLLSHSDIQSGDFYLDICEETWWAAHWRLETIDSAHYQIVNRHSGFCPDAHSDISQGSLRKVVCNTSHWSQHWELLPSKSINLGWDPYISNDCYLFNDSEENGWYRIPNPPSANCDFVAQGGKPLSWTISSHNESFGTYTPGQIIGQNQIGPDMLWDFAFHPKMDGTHQLGMALDKVSHLDYLDQYTWVGFSDNFDQNFVLSKPRLNKEVYADIRIGLFGAWREWDPVVGQGKGRLQLGVLARWAGKDHYLEVVFWDHPEFDGCTGTENWWGTHPAIPCDTSSLYQRRSDWGTGEAVYYYAGSLEQLLGYNFPVVQANSEMLNYRIPLTKLFKTYSWAVPPVSWDEVELAGVYIGAEVWGKAWVWFEMDNYRLYQVE